MLGLALPAVLRGPGLWVALALLALSGGWGWLRLVHDPAVRAAYKAKLDEQVAAIRIEDAQNVQIALIDVAEEHLRQLAAASTIRERILRVPVTTACVASPAVAAALDGLRHAAGGAGAAAGATGPAGVPGRPGAAAGRE